MIDLLPSAEQLELVGAIGTVLQANEAGINIDPQATWESLFEEVGALDWLVLSLPPSEGGAGFTVTDEFLMFVELGRWMAPIPLLWSSLAAEVAARAGEALLAEEIRLGRVRVALAQPEGTIHRVLRGTRGDLAVLRSGDEWLLVDLDTTSSDFSTGVDPSLRVALQDLTDAPVRARYQDLEGRIRLRAGLLDVAMLVGIADATCKESVDYAKTREQFGRPIGTNQVLKHRCADMAVRAAAALALSSYAAVLVESGDDGAEAKLASARLIAADAALTNAAANIRNHGAVGFTYANRAHWYLRRARVLRATLDPAAQESEISRSDRTSSA